MERHYNFYLSASLEGSLFFACVRAGEADGAGGEDKRGYEREERERERKDSGGGRVKGEHK